MASLQIDFDHPSGAIKPLHCINNAPILGADDRMFHYLGEAGIPSARLHDTGGGFGGTHFVDIENIFPNFDADPEDPSSYDFAFTDWLLCALARQGVKPFYRLAQPLRTTKRSKPTIFIRPGTTSVGLRFAKASSVITTKAGPTAIIWALNTGRYGTSPITSPTWPITPCGRGPWRTTSPCMKQRPTI